MNFIIACTIAGVLAVVPALATPIVPTDPVDLKGKVVGFVWIDKTYFECGGISCPFGILSASEPAHYLVILKTVGADKIRLQKLTSMLKDNRLSGLSHPIMLTELRNDEVLVEITSTRILSLKAEAMIELTGYSLSGDERVTVASHRALRIEGKVIVAREAEQAGAGQPATAPESKSGDKEKPHPESKPAPR